MGLYDDRLADLSEARRGPRSVRNVRRNPFQRPGGERPYPAAPRTSLRAAPRPVSEARKSTSVQSLLFGRDSWTVDKAKAWAKSHGYKSSPVRITDDYVHIQQFSPKKGNVKRTIPFGRGIRAVIAREEGKAPMAKANEASRRRRRPRRRKARASAAEAPRRRRRKAATRPKRRHRRKARAATRRRRRSPAVMEARRTTRRRRRRARAQAWRGNSAGHAKAARKGWRRKRATKKTTRRRRRHAREEPMVMEAPRRRRRRRARAAAPVAAASRRRRRHSVRAGRGGGMGMGELFAAALSGGVSFVLADGVDRFLATYDPAATGERPKDKFTSDGAGTLANTLNVASRPGLVRVGAGVVLAALPTAGAYMSRGGYMKASMEGAAFGAWISAFKTLWNTTLMPLLIGKDTSPAALQKSFIARLYPSEVSATVNRKAEQSAVSAAGGAGALSGTPDVGPFALAADSPYPDAAQALRRETGVTEEAYPSVQNAWGTGGPGSDYPTAAQAMRRAAGMSAPAGHGNPGQPGVSAWEPGPPPGPGPGPQAEPHTDPSCGCMADGEQYAAFLGAPEEETPPFVSQ